jgi:transcriptional regulator with PAS, ATPase and Fis domain
MAIEVEGLDPKSLVTVVYGCHRSSHRRIKKKLSDNGIYSFIFSEYFYDKIIIKGVKLDDIKVSMPFLLRMISEYKFQLEPITSNLKNVQEIEGFKVRPKTSDTLRNNITLSCTNTPIWKSHKDRLVEWQKKLSMKDDIGKSNEDQEVKWQSLMGSGVVKHIKKVDQLVQDSYENDVQVDGADYEVKYASYCFQLLPFLKSKLELYLLRIPIKSYGCIYGQLLVIVPMSKPPGRSKIKANKIKKTIIDTVEYIQSEIVPQYLDTIILLHENNFELKLKETITDVESKPKGKKRYKDVEEIINSVIKLIKSWGRNDKNDFENGLWGVWQTRKKIFTEASVGDRLFRLNETLHFAKYNVASLEMLNILRETVSSARKMRCTGEKGSVASALIYGEAGSGKDTLAKIIHLFSGYSDFELDTINMAALKPAFFTIPQLFGIDLPGNKIPGLFDSEGKQKKAFILDELNSMDYDVQGSLLRLLENGEKRPLFSVKDSLIISTLVIGIVNEDPDEVMREKESSLLKNSEPFLGKAISAIMYETMHKTRRLRPDLVYRLKRGIYVKLPPLRKRREDIPFLFNAFLTKNAKDKVFYNTSAFDALMNPSLEWSGNIRELQALASKVSNMLEKYTIEPTLILESHHITDAMREIYIEIDDNAFEI